MTTKQRNGFFIGSILSVFVMAVAVLFTGGKLSSFKTPFARATNSGNYTVSFNRTICGNTGYNSDDFTKESQLSVSKSTVYAHAVKAMVTSGTDFARFRADANAYIEFYIDSNVSFQEITGFSFTYNSSYSNGDFDIYLSTDGSTYPASPNAEVRNAPATVNLSGYNVKKIKFAGLSDKYAYFNTITINYACGEAAPKSLSSISVSGQTNTFDVDDSFVFDGTVTAHYSDSTSADVTSSAIIDSSEVNMSAEGVYEVDVSYSDVFGSASTSYSINVVEGAAVTSETYSHSFTTNTYEITISSDFTGYYSYINKSTTYYTMHFTWSLSGSTYTFTKDEKSGDREHTSSYYYRCLFGGSNTTNSGTLNEDTISVKLRNPAGEDSASYTNMKKVVAE